MRERRLENPEEAHKESDLSLQARAMLLVDEHLSEEIAQNLAKLVVSEVLDDTEALLIQRYSQILIAYFLLNGKVALLRKLKDEPPTSALAPQD